jgi:hypothetical protein
VDASQFDVGKLIRDCELFVQAANSQYIHRKPPVDPAAFAPHVSHDRILDAEKAAASLGLTEEEETREAEEPFGCCCCCCGRVSFLQVMLLPGEAYGVVAGVVSHRARD